MYYDTVTIQPSGAGCWTAAHSQQAHDRMPAAEYTPSALGYFHYPRDWGVQKGFAVLKAAMIKRHEDEIAALSKSLANLRLVRTPPSQWDCRKQGDNEPC
jgi:hypothetical protein